MQDTITVVLAGGEGRRMGGNKPLYPFADTTLIEATIARIRPQAGAVYINAPSGDLDRLGLAMIADDPALADLGPLSGVRTALKLAVDLGLDEVVTVPCDMPYLPQDMVAQLTAAVSDIAYFKGARDHPLCAIWRTTILPALEAALRAAEGGLPVMRFIESQRFTTIMVADEQDFRNINRPEDV